MAEVIVSASGLIGISEAGVKVLATMNGFGQGNYSQISSVCDYRFDCMLEPSQMQALVDGLWDRNSVLEVVSLVGISYCEILLPFRK